MREIGFALAGAFLIGQSVSAQAVEPRYAAILMGARSGEVLYESGADMPLHPASITKMMTLYLTFEALEQGRLKLTDPVVFSRHATEQRPSRLGVPAGKSLPVDSIIRAIAVKSANDAAVALAEKIDGSEEAFAAHMTRTAHSLGMRNTNYVNASGLSNAMQLTSARDIAILSSAILKRFPARYRYFGTRTFDYASASWVNHNHLLGKVPGVDGIKTGYTVDAGFTLAASAERNGTRLIAVVLGAKSPRSRDTDVTSLLDLGFDALDRQAHGDRVRVADNFRPGGRGVEIVSQTVEQGSSEDSDDKPRAGRAHKHKAGVKKQPVKAAHSKHHVEPKHKSSAHRANAHKSEPHKVAATKHRKHHA